MRPAPIAGPGRGGRLDMDDHGKHHDRANRPAASLRAVEAGAALLFFALGLVVIYDSVRLGARWVDDGPQAGYFPFYIGLLLCAGSASVLFGALGDASKRGKVFVTRGGLRQVLTLVVPAIVYVGLIGWLGIYVSSALFIAFFRWWLGRYPVLKIVPVSVGVVGTLFVLLDLWFKVPLPKGPLEAALGLN